MPGNRKTNTICEVSNMLDCYMGGYCGYCADDKNWSPCPAKKNCPYRLIEASVKQLDRISELVKDVPIDDNLITTVRVYQHSEPGERTI